MKLDLFVDIEVTCHQCESPLEIESLDTNTRGDQATVRVYPCQACIDAAKADIA